MSWLQYGYDKGNSHRNPVASTLVDYALKWSYTTTGNVRTSPVFTNDYIYFTNTAQHLFKLDMDGNLVWDKDTGVICEGVAKQGPKLFVSGNNPSLHAYDLDNNWLWNYNTFQSGSPPKIDADGNIWINRYEWDNGLGYKLDSDGNVLSAITEKIGSAGSECCLSLSSNKVARNAATDIWHKGRSLHNISDCSLVWEITGSGSSLCPPVFTSVGELYMGSEGGRFSQISLVDGSEIWGITIAGSNIRAMALGVSDAIMYVGTRSITIPAVVKAINLSTHAVEWTWTHPGPTGLIIDIALCRNDSRVFVATYNGWIYILDGSNGNQLFSYNTGSNLVSTAFAVADNGQVIIGGDSNKLYCFGSPLPQGGGSSLPLLSKLLL